MKKPIAIIRIIGVLFALMIVIASCTGEATTSPTATPEPESTVVAMEPTSQPSPTPRPADTRNEAEDPDGDGFIGEADFCPDVAGTFDGCPDTDGDRFPDDKDACPTEGDLGDGVDNTGCPFPPPTLPDPLPDMDGDGVFDNFDLCPTVGGVVNTNGCPDTDGDGIFDDIDGCPTQGNEGNGLDERGCPNPISDPEPDTDGDGIGDNTDQCPSEGSMTANGQEFLVNSFGCQPDTDDDGIKDYQDTCPLDGDLGLGVYSDGCPIRADQDRDDDSFFDDADQCPEEGNIFNDLGNFAVDETGCQPDSDGDGFKDYEDVCPTQADEGYGVDGTGCPNPDPFVEVGAGATINMGIEAYCQYYYTQPTAVFALSNPNETDINASYTDQDGNTVVVNIPSGGTIYQYVTPNGDGLASIQFVGVTNNAQVTNCFTAQLSVTETACINGSVSFVVFNSGPGIVQSGINWQLFGTTTANGTFGQFGDEMNPNEQFTINAPADAQGFLRFVVGDYGFSYTNTEPCLPSQPAPNVVVTDSTCVYVPEFNLMRLSITLTNTGNASVDADESWRFVGSIQENGFWGVVNFNDDVPRADFAPNDTRVYQANVDGNGFARFESAYLTYTNPEPCLVPDAVLEVTEVVCQFNPFENVMEIIFTIINTGEGYLSADAEYTITGATVRTAYISPFIPREPLAPNETSGFSINPDANGFATLVVPDYLNYTNPEPCLPAPEVTPPAMSIVATCESREGREVAIFTTANAPNGNYIYVGLVGTTEMRNDRLVVIVIPNEQGFASVDFGVPGGYAERICGAPPEVTPEVTSTPDAPTTLVLPNAPTFSLDSITCPAFNTMSVQVTNGDVTAYGQQIDALLRQMVPEGALPFEFFYFYREMGGTFGSQIIVSHTAPYNAIAIYDNPQFAVGTTNNDGVMFANGTQTLEIIVGNTITLPDNLSFYLTVFSAEKAGIFLNSLLQPLVDKYNNGEAVTSDDLNAIRAQMTIASFIDDVTFVYTFDSELADDCFYANQPDLDITVTQQCDNETGINTIGFELSGVDSINALRTDGNSSLFNLINPIYVVGNGQFQSFLFQDGIQTVEVNTTGLLSAQITYSNPEYINRLLSNLLQGGGAPSGIQEYLTFNVSLCTGGGVDIPQPPSLFVESATCQNSNTVSMTLNWIGSQAYLSVIDATLAPLAPILAQGQITLDANTLYTMASNAVRFPAVITHSTPLDMNSVVLGGNPPNMGYSTVDLNIPVGGSQTVTISITGGRPSNAPLYVTALNPYLLVNQFMVAIAPLIEDAMNGETVTLDAIQALLNSYSSLLDSSNRTNATLLATQNATIDTTLLSVCVPTLQEFTLEVSQSCNYDTAVNTITITLGGTASYPQIPTGTPMPVTINGTVYTVPFADGANPIDIDTTGLTALEIEHINPAYVNMLIVANLTGTTPTGELPPENITRDLILCVDRVVTLPTPPTFSVDSFTCSSFGNMAVQFTQGDVNAYLQDLALVVETIMPDMGGFPVTAQTLASMYSTLPVIISHTAPLTAYTPEYFVAYGTIATQINAGTFTVNVALSSSGAGLIAGGGLLSVPPVGAPLYLNFPSVVNIAPLLNTLFQPFVERHNNGETLTLADLQGVSAVFTDAQLYISFFTSQAIDAQFAEDCFLLAPSDLQVVVSEQCNNETGINTISFDISGVATTTQLLGIIGITNPSTFDQLTYDINTTSGTLLLQDGIQTVEYDTTDELGVLLSYFNPAYLNAVLNQNALGVPLPADIPQFVSQQLSLCRESVDSLSLPTPPQVTVDNLTCGGGTVVVNITYPDATQYIQDFNAVLELLYVYASQGQEGAFPFDASTMVNAGPTSLPVFISHTTPLNADVLSGGTPPNLVTISAGAVFATQAGTQQATFTAILVAPPAGVPLYINFINPYANLHAFGTGFQPLIDKYNNGEPITLEEFGILFTSLTSDLAALYAQSVDSDEIDASGFLNCFGIVITPDVTPDVTPTEDITPIVTPTEDITPIVTPTPDVTPEVVITNFPVIPHLECVDDNGDGTYTAYFGYNNRNTVTIVIELGSNNLFVPGAFTRGQPTTFLAGVHRNAFSVVFDGNELTWILAHNGYSFPISASNDPNLSCDTIVPDSTPVVTPDVVISNLPITPLLECVADNGDGTYTAYFGYNNPNTVTIVVVLGSNNLFVPGAFTRGQPTAFLAGVYRNAFSVVFNGNEITWMLTYGGYTQSASASNDPNLLCDDVTPEVTPTEDITPIVTPTEEITPIVTPTEEVTPVVTPTEDIAPEVTPTEDITPEVTPTEDITPEATPTMEVTPTGEVTLVVTDVPTDIPPTLEPTPDAPPTEIITPEAPTPICGAVSFGNDGFPQIDVSGGGCVAQEERPAQNWSPIVIGGAVCLPEIMYHTNETGDWEIFWASANRAPENLSNGVGTIDLAPTRSPDGQWLAFSSNRDGNWEIYASRVDGSQTIRLTDNDSAVDFDPSWSPDGTKIVYESNVDGNWELRMIDLLTGEKTRLTDHPAPDVNPAWHPNGTHIAFQSSRNDGLWQLYELEIATGGITRLSDGTSEDTNPQYSPDGESILYKSSNSELRSLFIMNRAGVVTATVNITNTNVEHGIWSSDGAYIAMTETRFDSSKSIIIYEVSTGLRRQLTADGASAFSPAWICDTTNVVFTSDALGNNNVYVLSAPPIDGEATDVRVLDPIIGDDTNQRDPQNSPSEEDASRGGNLPPK